MPHVDVADRAARQVQLKRPPALPVVERDEHAGLGAGIEEPAPHRIFAHHVQEAAVRDAARDPGPRSAAVPGPQDDRREVVDAVPVDRDVSGLRVEVRRLDDRHLRPRRQIGGCDVLPGLAVVPRQPDLAVVGAAPDPSVRHRRWRDGVDHPASRPFDVGILRGHRVEGRGHRGALPRQVGARLLPVRAPVRAPEEHLPPEVESLPVARRDRERQRPLAPVLARIGQRGIEIGVLQRAPVEPPHRPAPHDVRILRIREDVAALAARRHFVPVPLRDRAVVGAHGNRRRAAILLRAVDPVREPVVRGDVVELRGWLVVPGAPALPAIHRDDRALVGGDDHPPRVVGIDPEPVIVVASRRPLERKERLPPVGRAIQRDAAREDDVGVLRIDRHAAEVPAPIPDAFVGRCPLPAEAGIVGDVEPAFLRVHDRVHAAP